MGVFSAKGVSLMALGAGATGGVIKVSVDSLPEATSLTHISKMSAPSGLDSGTVSSEFMGREFQSIDDHLPVDSLTGGGTESQFSDKEELFLGEREKTEEERARLKREAKEAYEKLDDYTFRIFSSCGKGTGWVLDYLLPENGSYPTTWYIATNAHVVVGYGFSENKYNQILPNSEGRIKYLRNRYRVDYSGMSLSKNAGTCIFTDWYGYFDWNMSKENDGRELKSDQGAVQMGQIYEPRLFYAPMNFLEGNQELGVEENNYKDFAVLEIEFKTPEYAKAATRGFADKYKVDSTKAINIFAKPLEEGEKWDEIEKNNENFYSFAYPHKDGDTFGSQKNWNEETLEADKLSIDPYNWYHKEDKTNKIKGFIPTKRAGKPIEWGKKSYSKVGHFYLVKNHPLAKGSSGSMFIDGRGNLMGLRSVGEVGERAIHTMIEPIRSNRVNRKGINTPQYDLILGGGNGQKTSYRGQVEKYITDRNRRTWLSARGWEHITKDNVGKLGSH